jgi:formamidopyrimidine-DNA glycosylase
MPELPEVYTITKDLKKHVCGHVIEKVTVDKNYAAIFPSKKDFIKGVTGKEIKTVGRIAKNILIQLENDTFIAVHLAMTGQIMLDNPEQKWVKVAFTLKKSGETRDLSFGDVRMFGKVVLMSKEEVKQLREKYGPEPINENLTPQEFLNQLQSKKTKVKGALLEQSIVAGLGNIYATDALFLAKIHPEKSTKDVTLLEATKLLEAARSVLKEGIRHRGSTLPDKMYVDVFGKPGKQQEHFKIYLKKRCPRCKSSVNVIKVSGRGTYFCGRCQK